MIALTGMEELDLRAFADACCDAKPPLVGIVREAVRVFIEQRFADEPALRAKWLLRRAKYGAEFREKYEQRQKQRRRRHLSLVEGPELAMRDRTEAPVAIGASATGAHGGTL